LKLHLEDGDELDCKLDTGSPVTILDRAWEPKLGKRLSTEYTAGFRGLRTNGAYLAPKLYLGSTPLLAGRRMLTDELENGRAILGMDILRHYCIQLDFNTRKIRFLDPDHLDASGLGKQFPISLSGDNHVVVHEDFLGAKKWVVDTGAPCDGGMTAQDFGLALRGQQVVPETDGPVNDRRLNACFSKADFGGNTYSNLLIQELHQDFEDGPNIIGLNILARNFVTFNFPKRMMYMKQVTTDPLDLSNFLSVEAITFLESMEERGQLPGRPTSKEEIDWISDGDDSIKYPVSRTFKFHVGGWLNVTPKIKALAANRAFPITVDHDLAEPDPAPSILKQLRVHFRFRGEELIAEATEGETLALPTSARVVAAYYGNLLGQPDDPRQQDRVISTYHYTVVQQSKSGAWNLHKAWRTDEKGHTLEQYQVR